MCLNVANVLQGFAQQWGIFHPLLTTEPPMLGAR